MGIERFSDEFSGEHPSEISANQNSDEFSWKSPLQINTAPLLDPLGVSIDQNWDEFSGNCWLWIGTSCFSGEFTGNWLGILGIDCLSDEFSDDYSTGISAGQNSDGFLVKSALGSIDRNACILCESIKSRILIDCRRLIRCPPCINRC